MKILLTLNKTYRGHDDMGYWYAYIPLKELGHDVIWYDTAQSDQTYYSKIIESFKPDLMKNPDIAMKIAEKGHQRFKRDHTSHIRLAKILKQIEEL